MDVKAAIALPRAPTIEECVERTRRIETKVTLICQHMGINATPGKVRMTVVSEHPTIIELTGLDVSFSDVLDFVRRGGRMTDVVTVLYRGRLIGSVANPKETT